MNTKATAVVEQQGPPSPARSAIPTIDGNPQVIDARRRLADAKAKLAAATRRVGDLTEQTKAARARRRDVEKRRVLDEATAQDVEAAKADLARLEPELADAQRRVDACQDAVEDLAGRLRETEAQAREEHIATLKSMRAEAVRDLSRALLPAVVANVRLLQVEQALRATGAILVIGPLALGELLHTTEQLRVRHADLVAPIHPADPLLEIWLRRARQAGFDVAEPAKVDLDDLLSRRGG